MKLLKKINNNFALAFDSKGEEVIVSGKGIGFYKMPCIIEDMSVISRTYYDIDKKYIGLLGELPEEVINISINVSDFAKKQLDTELSPNIIFTLADHINFSIERHKKGITFSFPLSYDFEQLYPKELTVGQYALKIVKQEMGIELPKTEIIGIAMNIVNAELFTAPAYDEKEYDELLNNITKNIENYFDIKIDKKTLNYSRFSTHLRYLFKRLYEKKMISSENSKIFNSLIKETPETYECVKIIEHYLRRKRNWKLDKEEQMYLILHVNRLISREDCNREGITLDT